MSRSVEVQGRDEQVWGRRRVVVVIVVKEEAEQEVWNMSKFEAPTRWGSRRRRCMDVKASFRSSVAPWRVAPISVHVRQQIFVDEKRRQGWRQEATCIHES
jgi:hypothetical protein